MASNDTLDWSDTDKRAVDLIRVLAMDAVQKVGSGHPGTAMSPAPGRPGGLPSITARWAGVSMA